MKYQIAIIGGGPAGYTAAEAAGKAGLSVVLFEKRSLGGVCLNEGCIPTKTLLYSAKVYDYAKHASKYAVNVRKCYFSENCCAFCTHKCGGFFLIRTLGFKHGNKLPRDDRECCKHGCKDNSRNGKDNLDSKFA